MVELSLVRDIVTIIGVLIALTYYIFNIRHQRGTRQTQILMQLFSQQGTRGVAERWAELMTREWDNVDDFIEKYPNYVVDLAPAQNHFESLGVLLKRKLVDVELIYELSPTNATAFWAKYGPIVRWVREYNNYPQYMRLVEYLSDEIVKFAESIGDPVVVGYKGLNPPVRPDQ